MIRESLIRRLPEIAFALLFGGGLVLGGDAALSGLPKFVASALPGMAAQAGLSDGLAHGVARFSVAQGFVESRFSPQVLYPVTATPKPDWLVEAMRETKNDASPISRPMIA